MRDQAFAYEARLFGELAVTPECKSLMTVYFLMEESKKRAQHTKNAPVTPVRKIGVIGAGVMGSAIAQLFGLCELLCRVISL